MKAIKISLTILVVGLIGYFVYQSIENKGGPSDRGDVALPENVYTQRINREIDSLKTFSDTIFAKHYYSDVLNRIDLFHKSEKLNKDNAEFNDKHKEQLSKSLLSAYIKQFNKYAIYQFNQDGWSSAELSLNRNEINAIKRSPILSEGNEVETELKTPIEVIEKYDEINSFISTTYSVSGNINDINNGISLNDVKSKVHKARQYLSNDLDNKYVNKNTDLKHRLNQVPNNILSAQLSFFNKKVDKHGPTYKDFPNSKAFTDKVYKPISKQLYDTRNFSKDNLGLSKKNVVDKFEVIIQNLKDYNKDAYNHDYDEN